MLRIVESGDIRDDGWLDLDGLNELGLIHGVRTERHLLRPFDLLVTARTASTQVALVPPEVSRTVAGSDSIGGASEATGIRYGTLALVLPHFILGPDAARQADDGERHF